MTRIAAALSFLLLLGSLAGQLRAELQVRLPEFETSYQVPTTAAPPARPGLLEGLDVAVLAVALCLASYLALKKRSRGWLFVLMVFSLLYFGLWRGGCICPVGAIQNVSRGLFDSAYAVPLAVLAFFLLPLGFTLFFGRTFCAAVCPLGAVQDLVAFRPVKVPAWLQEALGVLSYVYLAAAVMFAAVGSAFIVCRYDPMVCLFRMAPIGKWAQSLWRGQQPPGGTLGISGRADLLLLTGAVLLIGIFVARPYCRFACPYGAILRLLSKLSKWHVAITPDECVKCRLCQDACPYGAIRKPTGEPSGADRTGERKRLAMLVLLLPVLVAAGSLLARAVSGHLAQMDYTVRLAQRVRLEETGMVQGHTNASEAFGKTGQPSSQLYRQAVQVIDRYAIGAWLFGGSVGLVIGAKLIQLSVRRQRTDYEPDRATCLSCGRCFAYCPVELDRRKKVKAAATDEGP